MSVSFFILKILSHLGLGGHFLLWPPPKPYLPSFIKCQGHVSQVLKPQTVMSLLILPFFQHLLPLPIPIYTTDFFFFFVVNFVIHWNETAMGLHVFPIPIPPPTSLSTRSHNWLLKGGFKRRTHVLGSWLEMLIAGSYSLTLCSWNSPGKNTGVGCHALLQRIFLTQGSNLGLLNYMNILYCMSHQGSPSLTLPFPKFD